jgi:hypothetical protein
MTTATLAALALGIGGAGYAAFHPSAAEPQTQGTISGRLDNATLSEALKWLADKGIEFVADSSEMGNARITINLKNQPIGDFLDAFASTFHGKWSRHGNVYSFSRDFAPGMPMIPGQPPMMGPSSEMPMMPMPPHAPGAPPIELMPKLDKELQLELKDLPEIELGDLKELKGHNLDLKDLAKLHELGPMIEKELKLHIDQKDMDELMKEGATIHQLKPDDIARLEELSPMIQKQLEHVKDLHLDQKKMEELMKAYPKASDPETMERLKALKMKLQDETLLPQLAVAQRADIGKLIGSLSARQLEIQKSKGYLTPKDLTPEQRAMLGRLPEGGTWSIAYEIDGKKLTIHSK